MQIHLIFLEVSPYQKDL